MLLTSRVTILVSSVVKITRRKHSATIEQPASNETTHSSPATGNATSEPNRAIACEDQKKQKVTDTFLRSVNCV
jgi:hypothetical protein